MLSRKEIFPETYLPAAEEVIDSGRALARDWGVGACEFLVAQNCASESVYKKRCMARGKIMQHAHMGFRDPKKSLRAYAEIYERCLSRGVEIDRYGICLDWSMGYPLALRADRLKGTGLILNSPEASLVACLLLSC